MQYWQQGTRINNDKYIVEKILGSGGFGITYKVKESRTNKQFAIKTLNYQCQQLPEFEQLQQKFINEALALASCRHPNVVRVYPQMFQESGLWCMVMEYVAGRDLASYLDRKGVFSEQEAIELISKLGNALNHVHQQGYLHRDIKPSNILLRSSDLSPILIDFGLAREYNLNTLKTMTNSLTESYAPIEQYESKSNFGAWTDVYALAATLYTLVTKELPIPSRFRIHASLVSPQQHNPNISNRLNEAILTGMKLQPSDRPRSVEEWLDSLKDPIYSNTTVETSNKGEWWEQYKTPDMSGYLGLDSVIKSKLQGRDRNKAEPTIYRNDDLRNQVQELQKELRRSKNDLPASNQEQKLEQVLQKLKEYRTVVIRNFSDKVSKQDLKEVFSEYGTVEQVNLIKHNTFKRSKYDHALIQMTTVEEANRAIQTLQEAEWMGKTIKLSRGIVINRQNREIEPIELKGQKIFIKGFASQINKSDLKRVFSLYGTVEQVRLLGGESALVQMRTEAEANQAIHELDGAKWIGTTIMVRKGNSMWG